MPSLLSDACRPEFVKQGCYTGVPHGARSCMIHSLLAPTRAERERADTVLAAAASDALQKQMESTATVRGAGRGGDTPLRGGAYGAGGAGRYGAQVGRDPAGAAGVSDARLQQPGYGEGGGGAGQQQPAGGGSSWGAVGRWARAIGSWSYGMLGGSSSPALAEKAREQQHLAAAGAAGG